MVASRRGIFDAVNVLIEAGADASQLQWTGLMQAIVCDDLENVKVLIGFKIPIFLRATTGVELLGY